jgi:hypothetical protein
MAVARSVPALADSPALASMPPTAPGLQADSTERRVEDTVIAILTVVAAVPAGLLIREADDLDAAIEVAARVPAARYDGAVEIRPAEVYW